jgi:dTDP-4-amino-4,6-dideoxygalactose transaminase
MPILAQPVYRKQFGHLRSQYPVAEWIDRSGFYIGCHQYLTEQEQDYVIDTLHKFFKTH